jgi:hypothetical protein
MSSDKAIKRSRASGESRKDRASEDRRVTADRQLTDSERLDLLRRANFQTALPDLPKIPGWHVFWATTTNRNDPIHGRLRLGYEFIKPSDVPGFESYSLKTGDYAGCIGVNEMIAMKLPLHLYEAYMRENHHDEPYRQQEAIYNESFAANEQALQSARRGGKAKGPVIEAGTEELGQSREAPNFSETEYE